MQFHFLNMNSPRIEQKMYKQIQIKFLPNGKRRGQSPESPIILICYGTVVDNGGKNLTDQMDFLDSNL